MKKETLKAGVIFLIVVLIALGISYAEKFNANKGELARLDNITGFIKEKTNSVLKADIRDGHGRIFLIVTSESKERDKVAIRMDLRNPAVNETDGSVTGEAKVEYKITNNGFFVVDPIPDENGYFHKKRVGQKEVVKEKRTENVVVKLHDNYIDVEAESFEVKDLLLK